MASPGLRMLHAAQKAEAVVTAVASCTAAGAEA